MSLPSTILDTSRYCTGKADFAIFKEEFMLGLESVGLADIVTGVQTEPLTEPTFTTIYHPRVGLDTLGFGSSDQADYKVRERKANLYIMTHIIDSKAIGCNPTKTAAENWKVVLAKYGTTSAVEQVMARERLTGLRLIPVHEDANEFTNHVATFKALLRSAIAARNKFEDGLPVQSLSLPPSMKLSLISGSFGSHMSPPELNNFDAIDDTIVFETSYDDRSSFDTRSFSYVDDDGMVNGFTN
ncbi:hypothetical protein C8J56DRAFT_1050741 [Mycena floridula]|nr:hypothetical protein C8J56DRAFT_1050741 [Mycena floridula]